MTVAIVLYVYFLKSSLGKLNATSCVAIRSDRIISLIYVVTHCDVIVVGFDVSYKSISINLSIDFSP